MSFGLVSPAIFAATDIPTGTLPMKEVRRLQRAEGDFIFASFDSLGYWIDAHFADCTFEDLLRVQQSVESDPPMGFAWLMCSRNPLLAFEKLAFWDHRLGPEHYAQFDDEYFRLDLDKYSQTRRPTEMWAIILASIYTTVSHEAQKIRLHLPQKFRALARFFEHNSDVQVLQSAEKALLEMPVTHRDEVTMQTYNPCLETMLSKRPKLVCLSRSEDILDDIRGILRDTMADQEYSLNDLADELRMSRRTLQRRLGDQGTSFKALRHQLQVEMLRQGIAAGESVDHLVERLGFSDHSAYYKLRKRAETSDTSGT